MNSVQDLMGEAVFHHEQGRLKDAERLYRRLLRHDPKWREPWYNLGLAQMQGGDVDAAILSWHRATQLDPNYGRAWINLGIALAMKARPEDAERALRQGLISLPDSPEAWNNLSIVLGQLNRADEAEEAARHALRLRPQDPEALNSLGMALHQLGRLNDAAHAYEQALALRPDTPRTRFNLSLVWLTQGRWEEGWAGREWRKQGGVDNAVTRRFPQPEWQGEDLCGRSILVYAEQGFGDSLHFMRYAAVLANRGAHVIAELPKPLARLAATVPGIHQVVVSGDKLPGFDSHLPFMSLPRVLGVTPENILIPPPYVTPPPSDWPKRLSAWPGLKVGLVWAGDPRPEDPLASAIDRRRSLRLDQLSPVLTVPGVTFISLQKGKAARQIKDIPIVQRPREVMDSCLDFADTAALIQHLDLVISVDTAVAHLAGALGKPVWILSRFDGCWRWLHDRDDTPWYPSARLFRQETAGNWAGVIDNLHKKLIEMVAGTAQPL